MVFSKIFQKIDEWWSSDKSVLKFGNMDEDRWLFLMTCFLRRKDHPIKNHLILAPTIERAEDIYDRLKDGKSFGSVYLLPGLESSPYSKVIPSEKNAFQRFCICDVLALEEGRNCIVLTPESLALKGPDANFFRQNHFRVTRTDIFSPDTLVSRLIDLGYYPSSLVEERGTFCRRGEIFDVYPICGSPVRLHYFDDMIEEIYEFSIVDQKTLRHKEKNDLVLGPTPYILAKDNFRGIFRKNLLPPTPGFQNRYKKRKVVLDALERGEIFEKFFHALPLFVEEGVSVVDFFDFKDTFVHVIDPHLCEDRLDSLFEGLKEEFGRQYTDTMGEIIFPEAENFYRRDVFASLLAQFKTLEIFPGSVDDAVSSGIRELPAFLGKAKSASIDRHTYVMDILEIIRKKFSDDSRIFFVYSNEFSLKNFQGLMDSIGLDYGLKSRVETIPFLLERGFLYPEGSLLILSDADLFSAKKIKTTARGHRNFDLFAEKFSQLKIGDFVVHADYGIGRYIGIKNLEIAKKEDLLVIEYAQGDKVYVPIYNFNLIQKHADSQATGKLDSLRTKSFQRSKSKARKSAKALAFDLIKLQAERASSQAFTFSPPDREFREFELSFPFVETADQSTAIKSVIEDMQKPKPMDRLVCGDVGFGKTEVAMRAAYKAILDKKQVAVVVPTTILALQHYNTFKERFGNVAVEIDFLSRFKSTKEARQLEEKIGSGGIDIVIGTHMLLAPRIRFFDLGLVVVDEEQRFGVAHKEKLKLLKSSVDFLTLTATPIPRTLQLALLGLRDFSLMVSPPPRRQSIQTYVVREGEEVIRNAIRRELSRGGQVFILHNRVYDIENYTAKIRQLVPDAKIAFAHGRLGERDLERTMNAFYRGDYQILVTTSIIESGLDIPNANTMIVDRADTYGLSQLHQLRGRIGRSERKAYCYFMIPDRSLTPEAAKRLKALQTYADLGSGFFLANSDLEIRGAGDILGAGQSGHIASVGLELYMDLLKEAIAEVEGRNTIAKHNVEIAVPFPAFIPDSYIGDPSLRLKYYKRLANGASPEALDALQEEMEDVFGAYPREVSSLIKILRIKLSLVSLAVVSLKIVGTEVVVAFDGKALEKFENVRGAVLDYLMNNPRCRLTPDYRVVYRPGGDVTLDSVLTFSTQMREVVDTA